MDNRRQVQGDINRAVWIGLYTTTHQEMINILQEAISEIENITNIESIED